MRKYVGRFETTEYGTVFIKVDAENYLRACDLCIAFAVEHNCRLDTVADAKAISLREFFSFNERSNIEQLLFKLEE